MTVSSVTGATTPPATAAAATKSGAASSTSGTQAFDALLSKMRQGATTPASGTSSSSSASGTGADQAATADDTEDRFLKLLVAQMRNQDPLNPMDNAAVTTQLAQINTVRGIEKMNTSLQKLVDRGASGSATEAAAMIGRRVLVEGDSLQLPSEGAVTGGFELAAAASSVRIDVLDAAGKVVDSMSRSNVPAGLQTFEWSGDAGASRAAAGTYSIRITASNGNAAVQATALTAAPVQAVARGTDGTNLQLGGFGTKPLDQVRAIL